MPAMPQRSPKFVEKSLVIHRGDLLVVLALHHVPHLGAPSAQTTWRRFSASTAAGCAAGVRDHLAFGIGGVACAAGVGFFAGPFPS